MIDYSDLEIDIVEYTEEIKQFVFPCKWMLESSLYHPQFGFKKVQHITPQEQIDAAAVDYGVSVCPFFDAQAFKEIGSRKIKKIKPL